ncbi:MAG: trehalose-6-phosphate synthase [Rhizobiales bacterium]|nr:trehalose-6-phosphate synthase [Hyphomicrobiales bacterium]
MIDDTLIQWSPQTLRAVLAEDLQQAELIVVSNREPYVHERVDGRIELSTPASGLVSALDPVMRAFSGTWIAYGGGSADRETVDARNHVAVPPDNPEYTLRRVWLSPQDHRGHYSGFSNEALWPLCHVAFARPVFRAEDWEAYRAVNRRFAEIVAREAKTERPVVLVQDYHFALLPAMLRELVPGASILTFWHIPWPNSELFGVCPWREQILDGLLGSSILGFQTQLHCNNFLDSVDRFLESRIDREASAVYRNGQMTSVNAYPISIRWPDAATASRAAARDRVTARHDIPHDHRIMVGVERLDYTKGIVERFHALDTLFGNHPEWRGKLVFIQVAAPSRSNLPAYQRLRRECGEMVDQLNARHGHGIYRPVIWLERHHGRNAIDELLRAADVCVVSSLHDGMNLVAKEFVAARDDEQGVLVLSAFAGVAQELADALIVNPYDATGMAEAMHRALTMPAEEQGQRMRAMREIVRAGNVYRWAGHMLLDAVQARRRSELQPIAEEG